MFFLIPQSLTVSIAQIRGDVKHQMELVSTDLGGGNPKRLAMWIVGEKSNYPEPDDKPDIEQILRSENRRSWRHE